MGGRVSKMTQNLRDVASMDDPYNINYYSESRHDFDDDLIVSVSHPFEESAGLLLTFLRLTPRIRVADQS